MANPVLSTKGLFTPSQPGYTSGQAQVVDDRMTFDDVLAKTALSLAGLFLVAAFAYFFMPERLLYPVGMVGGLAAVFVPFVVIRSRAASPAGNIAYAVAEGLLLAAFSRIFEAAYPGIIVQGVLGTFMAAAVTLIAYRYGGFRISSKASKILRLGMFAFVGVALLNLVLFFFGINTGLLPGPGEPVSLLAWVFALVGIGLAVYSLVDDFQYVEAGVNAGAPRSQGWVAAFGISVTMVWLYINIVRILSYFRR
ncbi:MAG: Bax inhibitor-1/YccA family protein [Propionibacteriaceae bacterium]|nr:Bax inhibitor-1/YccA family protein [Propionibacteriaceae bacterium]